MTPVVTGYFATGSMSTRIVLAIVLTFPIGLLMGMAFPIGMKLTTHHYANMRPWLWGVNGATSVCASVFAVAISINWSISTSFLAGLLCYGIAFIAFIGARRVVYNANAFITPG
jgi:hypothetical protein